MHMTSLSSYKLSYDLIQTIQCHHSCLQSLWIPLATRKQMPSTGLNAYSLLS